MPNDLAIIGGALIAADAFKPGGVRAILDRINTEVRATPTDVTTPKGRDAIKSLAYKVARSKTALDDAGKKLTDDQRKTIDAVNADRRIVREELDALAEWVRAPLVTFEAIEKKRVADHEDAIAAMGIGPAFYATASIDELQERLDFLHTYPTRDWQEFEIKAMAALSAETQVAMDAMARAVAVEADRVEAARLRAEQEAAAAAEAERQRTEREARIAAEAAEAAKVEAEAQAEAARAAEAKRVEDERAADARRVEAERQAAEGARQVEIRRAQEAEAKAAAAERARVYAEQKAEQDRIAASAQAEKASRDAEAAAARAAQDAVDAEKRRVADIAAAEAREADKRARDKAHKSRINGAALAALSEIVPDADMAKAVITAIARGEVPHVSIAY